jgi:hypothetical protein
MLAGELDVISTSVISLVSRLAGADVVMILAIMPSSQRTWWRKRT